MTVADSLIYPQESDSKYPYTDNGDREFLDGKEFIETMVLLRAPVRGDDHAPVHSVRAQAADPSAGAGRQAGLVAGCLSDNRLGLGVGISPWPEDFAPSVSRARSAASGWTSAWTSSAASPPVTSSSTTASSTTFDAQAVPGADRADPAAGRRPRRRRAAPRRTQATAGCTPAVTARSSTGCSTRLAEIREEEGGLPRRLRGARDLLRRLQRRRHQAPRGQGRHRLHRRLPGALHQGPRHRAARGQDPQPGEVREKVIAKV